jgi:hypothetical protein
MPDTGTDSGQAIQAGRPAPAGTGTWPPAQDEGRWVLISEQALADWMQLAARSTGQAVRIVWHDPIVLRAANGATFDVYTPTMELVDGPTAPGRR